LLYAHVYTPQTFVYTSPNFKFLKISLARTQEKWGEGGGVISLHSRRRRIKRKRRRRKTKNMTN